ncbi:hypothetical protein FNF31_05333 [Cafeteria roenbergensis]|uniref:Thioredoxin domain-containing protein n=1 Tax=Cafeteria roenbergensis TaxID=33653 RepID=A0A5A8E000_CAFRO|nr:hypothetical protein FNF31_05333 [Cafeteria roenbergensis]KAA0171082.1 hypothetical protein FNF28_01087 [Cafeteria roenbergensis]
MRFGIALLSVALVALSAEGKSKVHQLTTHTFNDAVSSGTWIVAFTAPWCGHCKKLKPELEKAAQLLDVNIGTVDATNNRDLAVRFGVHGYPTVFHINEDGEVRFAGVRSVQAIRSFVTTQYKHVDPMPYWTSPMNPIALAKARIVKAGMWVASFDEPIADATGIPKMGVQFAFVLLALMMVAFGVVVAAWLCSTQGKPRYRDFYRQYAALGEGGRRPHRD